MAKVNIYQRGDTLWLSKYSDGKQVRVSTELKNTNQNLKYLEKNKDYEFEKLTSNKNRPSVAFYEYAQYILESTKNNRISQSQDENLKKVEVLNQFFNNKDVTDIKFSDVQSWQNMMLEKYAPKTVINYRSVLNMILKNAYFDELINKNPLEQLKAPKLRKELPHFYCLDDIKKIIYHATGQFANLVKFAFFSGMILREIIALEWKDINFETNTIRVNKRVRDGIVGLPKGEKARIIDLLPQAQEALLKQRALTGMKTHIFVTQYGDRYNTPDVLDVTFKKVCKNAGVKIDRFYNTKHTFTTMMLENGMNETWLTQQLGHENIDITRKHYAGKIKPDLDKLKGIAV